MQTAFNDSSMFKVSFKFQLLLLAALLLCQRTNYYVEFQLRIVTITTELCLAQPKTGLLNPSDTTEFTRLTPTSQINEMTKMGELIPRTQTKIQAN